MHKQLTLLTFIRALRMFMITMPVIVIYWQNNGLGVKDIFILQVIFSIAVVAFEIPSGFFADRYGRKPSMVLGCIFGTLGFYFYYAIPSYLGFVIAEITLALSAGFISGARDALLFETLRYYKKDGEYSKYQGKLLSVGNVSEAVAAVLAGVIASKSSIESVMLIQWLVIAVSIPLSLSLKEMPKAKETPIPLLKIIKGSVKENRVLQALNIYAGLLSASTLCMVWFIQPHWEVVGIPIVYFGYIWAVYNLIVGFGSFIAGHLERYMRFRTLFLTLALAVPTLYGLMSLVQDPLLVVVVASGFWLLRGVSLPVIQDYVQREARDSERATVLSINALFGRIIFSATSPLLGYVADVWSITTAFMISGALFGTMTLLSWWLLVKAKRS